jgi:hypothetical protein
MQHRHEFQKGRRKTRTSRKKRLQKVKIKSER